MRDLNDAIDRRSGWTLETARAINDAGQIAGSGRYRSTRRAYLLAPRQR